MGPGGRQVDVHAHEPQEVGPLHRGTPDAVHVRVRLAGQYQAVEVSRREVYTGGWKLLITMKLALSKVFLH